MPKPPLYARPPADPTEDRTLRKLAGARHAPASWIQRARIITLSWQGAKVDAIATQVDCHPITASRWIRRFNRGGLDALGDRPRPGRPRRLTELDRGMVIALARSTPPGRLTRQPDGSLAAEQPDQAAHWTLDALAGAAGAQGVTVSPSQVRRILTAEGVRWRPVRSWSTAAGPDPDFAPKGPPSLASTPLRPRG